MGMMIRRTFLVAFMLLAVAPAEAQTRNDAEAIRLNNRGVAQMGQQLTERAESSFAQALKKDPKFAQAAVNDGIALLTLQKLDDAKAALKHALALDAKSAQAWYNLGLAQRSGNELEPAIASFQQAVKIDPHDADSLYFEGACYQEMKEFDKAIAVFQQTLAINPLHASAEFGLARALQRTGKTAEAKEHFARFQHLTNSKISSALGLTYGEQGHYSIVTTVEGLEQVQHAMIPVKMVAEPMLASAQGGGPAGSFTGGGGACMLDVTGSGQMDLVLMQTGAQAIRVLHREQRRTF